MTPSRRPTILGLLVRAHERWVCWVYAPLVGVVAAIVITAAPVTPGEIRPRAAIRSSGEDVTSALAERDGRRVVLQQGEHVDVYFDAPPPAPGLERTVVASMRGYYAMDIGGRPGVNPAMLLAHRLGLVSLQGFAGELARAR